MTAGLHGGNLIGNTVSKAGAVRFRGVDPTNGISLQPEFVEVTTDEIEAAVHAASAAAPDLVRIGRAGRAAWLRGIGGELDRLGGLIVSRTVAETGRDLDGVEREHRRCIATCEMFARVAEDSWWRDVHVDHLERRNGGREALLGRVAVPVGPVAVFGAANVPLMGGAAGTDVVAALAAGCPVVVKSHPAHPGVGELLATAVLSAAAQGGIPNGAYSLLHGISHTVGVDLVGQPGIKAVAFTGSLTAGRALHDAAARRTDPIPVFAEMGSVNPMFIMTSALGDRELAGGIAASVSRHNGQLCTKPGVVLVPNGPDGDGFVGDIVEALQGSLGGPMLHEGIRRSFEETAAALTEMASVKDLTGHPPSDGSGWIRGVALSASAESVLSGQLSISEVFGPLVLIVRYRDENELSELARQLDGQLTASIWAADEDLDRYDGLVDLLVTRAGRVLWRDFPTGTPNTMAMHHGGPYPASTDARYTSVGPATISKFVRPVALQNFPRPYLTRKLEKEELKS